MQDTLHHYSTTLNGGIVTVDIDLSIPSYLDRLTAVWFEDTDVTSILDPQTLTALSMEAERAYSGDNVGDFDPARDAHRLGD
jgi:hypothetical protein